MYVICYPAWRRTTTRGCGARRQSGMKIPTMKTGRLRQTASTSRRWRRPVVKGGNPLRRVEGVTKGGFYAMHRAAGPTLRWQLIYSKGKLLFPLHVPMTPTGRLRQTASTSRRWRRPDLHTIWSSCSSGSRNSHGRNSHGRNSHGLKRGNHCTDGHHRHQHAGGGDTFRGQSTTEHRAHNLAHCRDTIFLLKYEEKYVNTRRHIGIVIVNNVYVSTCSVSICNHCSTPLTPP